MNDNKVYSVPISFLVKVIIASNAGVFGLYFFAPILGMEPLSFQFALGAAVFVTLVQIIAWRNGVPYNMVSIKISRNTIEGPSPTLWKFPLPKEVILISEIDKERSNQCGLIAKWYRWTDVWSQDGRRIRLYHSLLGKKQIQEIKSQLGLHN